MKPVVELGDYKDLELHVDKTFVVSDIELENELEAFRQHNTQLEVIENDEVKFGDITKINFEGFKDGIKFEGGTSENHSLEIGSGSFIPGFEEQVIGMKLHEEKDIVVTFPEDYHANELAGTSVTFKVKVNEISRKLIPKIDDHLAKDFTEFETLDELKAAIHKSLTVRREAEAYNYKGELAINRVLENANLEVPVPMIETEFTHMITDLEQRVQSQGADLETFLQYRGMTKEDLEAQFKIEAEKRVNTQLVLEAIAREENIVVTEEDIDYEINFLANMYKKQPEELRSQLAQQGNEDALKNELEMRKALEFLVKNNTFK